MTRTTLTLEKLGKMTPDDAAALWLVRRAEPTAGDDALFEAWLTADGAHADAWERAATVWNSFESAKDSGQDPAFDELRLAARSLGPEPSRQRWLVGAVAAGLAALAAIAGLSHVGLLNLAGDRPGTTAAQTDPFTTLAGGDIVTGRGQRTTADLPDGTKLTLDTGSAVNIAYADGKRRIKLLRGQAYFAVVHDAAHPFIVSAGELTVTDLGTRFDVRLDPTQTSVFLVDGRLSVAHFSGADGSSPVELHAGEQFTSTSGADLVTQLNSEAALAWQDGAVVFHNETLAAAIAELNRYSRRQIIIRDSRVASLRISGRFSIGDIDRFCRTVTLIHLVRIVPHGPEQIEIVAARR